MTEASPIRHVPTVPFDPYVPRYSAFGGYYEPFEFTGWVDESMSWKEHCYIGDWSPMPKIRLVGPDALRFFSETTINSYASSLRAWRWSGPAGSRTGSGCRGWDGSTPTSTAGSWAAWRRGGPTRCSR